MAMAGLIHLYVGDGKGKTTAAAGLALRALGCGRKVLFGQFLKGRPTGEIAPLAQQGAKVMRAKVGEKFIFQMSPEEKEEAVRLHIQALEEMEREIRTGQYDLAILDEVVDAVNTGVIPLEKLTALLDGKPDELEVVLTGRNPPPEIVERSDYYTEFVCRKHPFQKGVPAREGIEY
jgi:cob(I)alamin adenosyltransferase